MADWPARKLAESRDKDAEQRGQPVRLEAIVQRRSLRSPPWLCRRIPVRGFDEFALRFELVRGMAGMCDD